MFHCCSCCMVRNLDTACVTSRHALLPQTRLCMCWEESVHPSLPKVQQQPFLWHSQRRPFIWLQAQPAHAKWITRQFLMLQGALPPSSLPHNPCSQVAGCKGEGCSTTTLNQSCNQCDKPSTQGNGPVSHNPTQQKQCSGCNVRQFTTARPGRQDVTFGPSGTSSIPRLPQGQQVCCAVTTPAHQSQRPVRGL